MDEVLKKLEDQLQCSICLETYKDPKVLQCNHVYCQECLVKLVTRDKEGQLTLICPECRNVTHVPASGVKGLQVAFRAKQLLEIVKDYRGGDKSTGRERPPESASSAPIAHCSQHRGMELKVYCETCDITICYRCIMKDGSHHSHNYQELSQVSKGEITSLLEPMEKQLESFKKLLEQFDARHYEIASQYTAVETDIHNAIMTIRETLDVKEAELISQLLQITQGKLKRLTAEKDPVEKTHELLKGCLALMKENIMAGSQGEMESLRSTTIQQVNDLSETFKTGVVEPSVKADIAFQAPTDPVTECGKVYAVGSPDPSKCYVVGDVGQEATVGVTSSVILQALKYNNQPYNELRHGLTCELVSELTGAIAQGGVEKIGQSQYKISYNLTTKGKNEVHIKVEDQHVMGSPFPVIARSPVEMLGSPIMTIPGVWGPEGIAINQNGEVVVTECAGSCVSVFSSTGKKLRTIGAYGSYQGQFQNPHGVAVDDSDNILVADSNNHRIQKFTAQGTFVTDVRILATEDQNSVCSPLGIASSGKNIYMGSGRCRIVNFNSDLICKIGFGKMGTGKQQFNDPRHIACDSSGRVYVADCGNHRIQVFSATGKFLRMFGKFGEASGELKEPHGVAIDPSGRVFVSEWGNHRVSVFTLEGKFVTSFGRWGEGPGEFRAPCGVAVDSHGIVYVCDRDNNCVKLF